MLLDSPILQRLRFVRQLGFSYLTYPNANHSRFEHSLGTYWVVRQLLDSAQRLPELETEGPQRNVNVSAVALEPASRRLVSMAALLHDIGHGPYSHALESLVDDEEGPWHIGPFSAKDFRAEMLEAQLEISAAAAKRKAVSSKSFCELFAAAVIVSPRFKSFYSILPRESNLTTTADEDVISLASLLLGSPIETNAPALANLISGPIDADKLDYMVRDAQACGISISLDLSRVLFRAGFYRLSTPSLHPHASTLDFDDAPVTVFVIEQSGTDALRELALSRLSLYSRVYYHQCTRNAEKLFSTAIKQWAKSLETPPNFLDVWTLGDEELLGHLRRTPNGSPAAHAIWGRKLPKRAVALTQDCYLQRDPPVNSETLAAVKKARKEAVAEADSLMNVWFTGADQTTSWREEMEAEVAKISGLLGLPIPAVISDWHTVPVPKHRDPTTTAVCLSDDRTVQVAEPHLPQFVKSGEFPIARRYLFCGPEYRDLFSISLQMVAFRLQIPFRIKIDTESSDSSREYEGLFRPVIDLDRSNQICKSRRADFESKRIDLAAKGYYNQAPTLLRYDANTARIASLGTTFMYFSGGHDWFVTPDSIRKYIEQFPPHLRNDVVDWLESLVLESWDGFAEKASQGIGQVKDALGAPLCWVVPLSFTSGTQICKALQARFENSDAVHICQDVREALQKASTDDALIFVDDNIASGTQAQVAIQNLMGIPSSREEKSTYAAKLEGQDLTALKERKVGFVFSWGLKQGLSNLEKVALQSGLKTEAKAMTFVNALSTTTTANMSDGLKAHLRMIGRQLVAYGEKKDGVLDSDAAYKKGDERALGYGNAEGCLIGRFGVPSSTYTALFLPGKISLTKDSPWEDKEFDFAWSPLFLRNQKATEAVFS